MDEQVVVKTETEAAVVIHGAGGHAAGEAVVDGIGRAAAGDFFAQRLPVRSGAATENLRGPGGDDGLAVAGIAPLQGAVKEDQAGQMPAAGDELEGGGIEREGPGGPSGSETGAFQTEIFLYRIRSGAPMKLFTATFFTVILVSLHAVVAQDASAVPIPDNNSNAAPTPSPLFPTTNPPPVVSKPHYDGGASDTERRPAGRNAPAVKQAKPPEPEVSIQDNIKYREAKTKALHDDKIQAALAAVDAAKTDPDKRAAWKQYYTLLAARILKIDGSIKKLVAARLAVSLKLLDQSKVRPEEYAEQVSASQ